MDLRKFIDTLDKRGNLQRVSRLVDWKFEIGEIVRRQNRPILFENIRNYKGRCIFSGGFSNLQSIISALGITRVESARQLIAIIKSRLKSWYDPLLVSVDDTREYAERKDVNLYELPVPWWNKRDGGRYIGTWHVNVSKDPVTSKRNCGVYRMMLLSKNQTTVSVSVNSHLMRHMVASEMLGRDLEMAVAIGCDEAAVMAAGAAVPYGVDEFSLAGALLGDAFKISRCNSISLEVPYNAEIVLEGVLKKGVRVKDGPFFDYTGACNVNKQAFLFEVRAVSKRKNPVFRGMSVGVPGAEDHVLFWLLSRIGLADFHSSRIRQKIQNLLLKNSCFRLFQYVGRAGGLIRKFDRSSFRETPDGKKRQW